jgi:hypothetical protein
MGIGEPDNEHAGASERRDQCRAQAFQAHGDPLGAHGDLLGQHGDCAAPRSRGSESDHG